LDVLRSQLARPAEGLEGTDVLVEVPEHVPAVQVMARFVRLRGRERVELGERLLELAGPEEGPREQLAGHEEIGVALEEEAEVLLGLRLLPGPGRLGRGTERGPDRVAVLAVVGIGRVVALPGHGVGQDLVLGADLLDLLGMGIRRVLPHEPEVGLLDRALVGGALEAEDVVVVLVVHSQFQGSSAWGRASASESTKTRDSRLVTSGGSSRVS